MFPGNSYQSYRESQISIPASVAAQAVSGISQLGDIVDVQDKFGGSRISRETAGIAGEPDDELLGYYDDR